jgi:hypothetical protein
LAIGSGYSLLLVLAYRYLGGKGVTVVVTLALAAWVAVFISDASGRFHAAAWSLRVAMVVLLIALSIIPALAVQRARGQAPRSYAWHAVYGLGGFFVAILASLIVGVPILVAGIRLGW